VTTAILVGPPAPLLLAETDRVRADVVAVGSHGNGRAAGVVLGSVATRVIHQADCSVLIARAATSAVFPRSVAVGVDGSDPSLQALESGRGLASRIGVPLRVLHVCDGTVVPDAAQADLDDGIEEIRGGLSPLEGLSSV
jgi:nucleotide-binding universal stress UspA family protein